MFKLDLWFGLLVVVRTSFPLTDLGLSSNNILTAGETSSSYWPLFTLQMKAIRKSAATEILANSSRIITLIGRPFLAL